MGTPPLKGSLVLVTMEEFFFKVDYLGKMALNDDSPETNCFDERSGEQTF